MYSFRSWKSFFPRRRIQFQKPYIPYTTIHRISFNKEAKSEGYVFLLSDNNIPRFSFQERKQCNPEGFLYENDCTTYHRISFNKETKERSEGKQYVFFLFDNDHTNYIFTEFPRLSKEWSKKNAMFSST